MRILLADADENDRFAGSLHHVESGADLIVHSIKLCQDNSVDRPRIVFVVGEVDQGLVELRQLINRVISNESFSYEKHNFRFVNMDQLGQLSHQTLIALHPSGSVDQNNIVASLLGFCDSFFGNI